MIKLQRTYTYICGHPKSKESYMYSIKQTFVKLYSNETMFVNFVLISFVYCLFNNNCLLTNMGVANYCCANTIQSVINRISNNYCWADWLHVVKLTVNFCKYLVFNIQENYKYIILGLHTSHSLASNHKLEAQGPCTGHRSIIAVLYCFSFKYMKREKGRDLTQYTNLCGLNTLPH